MTGLEFASICQASWGSPDDPTGFKGAAAFLQIQVRNVRRFAAGTKDIGPGLETQMWDELREWLTFDPDTKARVIRIALGNDLDVP